MLNIPSCALLALACVLSHPACAAVLAGKVINAEAGPVANAQVSAGKTATRTDNNGYFKLQVPDTDAKLQVFQSAYGVAQGDVTPPESGVLVYLSPNHATVLQPAAHNDSGAVQGQSVTPERISTRSANLDTRRVCQVCSTYLPMSSGG